MKKTAVSSSLRQLFHTTFLLLLLVLVMGIVGAQDHPVKETPWQGEALKRHQSEESIP